MKVGKRFISGEDIRARAKQLAREIDEYYGGSDRPLVCVCVLRGAALFFADLVKYIAKDMRMEFVSVHSYDGTKSCDPVLVRDAAIQSGADVLVVEDIVDTGKTAALMKDMFMSRGANSVKLCSMVARHAAAADWIGFVIDTDKFFIGYGLDHDQRFRNMDGIYEFIPDET